MTFEPVTLVNGTRGGGLSAFDRGLMYGDGVFRTLRIRNGQPRWIEDHLAKLASDAARLGIHAPSDPIWRVELEGLIPSGVQDAAAKLILTRGVGQRGYRPEERVEATRILTLSPLPANAQADQRVRLRVCAITLGEQPALAGVKHLNRLENVLARMEWSDPDIHEGLLLDSSGRVICGTSSNLFIVVDGVLKTPSLQRCGVAGITRDRVLARAGRLKLRVEVTDMTLDDVYQAEEVMIANSLTGLRSVQHLGTHRWSEPQVCPQLSALLDE